MTQKRKALVFGATGLIGKQLIEQLRNSDHYKEVAAVVRKEINLPDGVKPFRFNFSDWAPLTNGLDEFTDVFCCIGTTRKKTPNLEEYKAIDYGIPTQIAASCAKAGCRSLHVVSAVGANKDSANFYTKLKGEMEAEVTRIFPDAYLYRPSLLLGNREETRIGEKVGIFLFSVLGPIIPSAYKGIHAAKVAQNMLATAQQLSQQRILDNTKMLQLK